MSNPYSQPTLSGYNSSPPSDDGSQTSANTVKWQTHLDKLTDPLKTFAQAVDTAVNTAFGKIFGANITTQSGNYTVTASDQGKFIEVDAAATITLLAAATAGSGFAIGIINTGSGTVTIDGNSSETINGAATLKLGTGESAVLTCDGSLWIAAASSSGIAKSFCHFNGTGSGPFTPTVDLNVTDVTDNGTGDYTVNFTNAFSLSTLYAWAGAAGGAAGDTYFTHGITFSEDSLRIGVSDDGGTKVDEARVSIVVWGTLA